jgi:S-(hydroxymethyl)glutathione dehydrogenase/alcohol dehydrogenase
VVIGLVPLGVNVEIPGLDIVFSAKTMVGSSMGSNRFRVDMPRYVDFYLRGVLKLDEMISARLKLDQVNEAFDKMRAREAARSVIVFDS